MERSSHTTESNHSRECENSKWNTATPTLSSCRYQCLVGHFAYVIGSNILITLLIDCVLFFVQCVTVHDIPVYWISYRFVVCIEIFTRKKMIEVKVVCLNTLRRGDADVRFYITTVQDGWRKSAFLTRACFPCTIHFIMQYIEPVSEWSCWRMFIETWPHSELNFRHRASSI